MKTPIDEPGLHGAHLKSWRAWELACQLQASIERWLHAGGYRLQRRFEPASGEHQVHVRFNALPGEWSLLIGECVQNLRNSLDNLVYALAVLTHDRLLIDDEAKNLAFPITGPKPLSSDRARATIGLLPEAVREFVSSAQPSAAGRPYQEMMLWALEMSNYDKHRLIPTALVSLEGMITTAPVHELNTTAPLQPIADGDWLASFKTPADLDPDDVGLRCSFEVVFDDTFGLGLRGVPVVTVLKDLREHVQRVHNQMLGLAGYDVHMPWQ